MKTVSNLLIYKCLCNCSQICCFLQYLQLCPKFNTFKVFNPLFTFKKIYQKIKLINKHNIHLVYISKENVAISMKISGSVCMTYG